MRICNCNPRLIAIASGLALGAVLTPSGRAFAEPAACLSADPSSWPAPSKPYFMLAADTSGSMTSDVGNPAIQSSCGFGSDRRSHLRCAIRHSVMSFSGQVHFGLMTFPRKQTNCGAACFGTCQYSDYPNNVTNPGCGPGTGSSRRGGFIQVPMLQDSFWQVPPPADNTATMLSWADNNCTGNTELFADGFTPLNGILLDARRYFSATGWTAQDNSVAYPTPLAPQDLAGAGVNGGTACRPVNVILITDGGETCDPVGSAVAVAADLYNNGVTVGGKIFKIRTYVINFAGGSIAESDNIAAAGGTVSAILANNETELSTSLANIVAGSIKPETCDNTDNNCNGCTDEGFAHYCNVGQTCCAWTTAAQRTTCLSNYTATINAGDPDGDLTKLPCTTVGQQADPANWLCFNSKESCDNVDNNCSAGVDEGVLKCGNPAHCPTAETCNGADDNCNGVVDEAVCSGCVPVPEICDGCDNDCDGLIDEGIASLPCGLSAPPNCAGQLACPEKANPGGQLGACTAGGWNTCSNNPQSEVCDSVDNDCDGIVDDSVAASPCVAPGLPPGLDYGSKSQCKKGTQACGSNQCIGFVGPSTELCDGIDNDCDGQVDENSFGVGQPCGVNQAPCSPGLTACVNGALVCQGGAQPQAELCDGLDNDCDGEIDDGPLADGPAAGQAGCWNLPGTCCQFNGLTWCPPPGASCNDSGSLAPPCSAGKLECSGVSGWVCSSSLTPSPEVCDGIDNDCDGTNDDEVQAGEVCGTELGECVTGLTECSNGVLNCAGSVGPAAEVCDGLDNDCDGTNDNGIVFGPCVPPFDTVLFPGPRESGVCQSGVSSCDGAGNLTCVGGVGPSPEVCNGIDDDCDGQTDETGAAPDGIDGTDNPQAPPAAKVGDACGEQIGACKAGAWACSNGAFECAGATKPAPESCNGVDDDCDGTVDNETGGSVICAVGATCVAANAQFACAVPCAADPYPCAAGEGCIEVTSPSTGAPLGKYCVPGAEQDGGADAGPDAEDDSSTAQGGSAGDGGGGSAGAAGAGGSGGSAGKGGSAGAAGSAGKGGSAGIADGGAEEPTPSSDDGGCACETGPQRGSQHWQLLVIGALGLLRMRTKRSWLRL